MRKSNISEPSPTEIESDSMLPQNLEQWAAVSNLLWWTVLIVCTGSLPILKYALYQMVMKYRKSHYFYFLMSMIVLDIAMLNSILINILADSRLPALKGNLMCKITAFITNMTACYVNWLWVVMFAQRFAYVFFPMQTIKPHGVFRLFDEAKILILMTGLIAVSTQAWWPLIMKEIHIVSDDGKVQGTYCGADTKLMAKSIFKWLGLADSLFSYAVPFSITLLTDLAVLICRTGQDNKKFKLLSSDNINNKERGLKITGSARRQFQSFKIQSEESKRASAERRQREIRRCLVIATVQLVLNLPNYILQLVDEFVSLQSSNSLMYLYADAIFYLLYLSQFPMLAVYVNLLHGNMNKIRRQSKKTLEKTCSTSLL